MTLSRRHNYEAWLVPYAEGTLDPTRAALLEARLARDPALAAQADTVRTVTAHLHQAAAQNSSVPDPRLAFHHAPAWPGVQKRLSPPPSPARQRGRWAGGACAAALALGALLLHNSLPGIGTRHAPAPPAQVAQGDVTPAPRAETPASARHKKGGRRTHSRPLPFALHSSKQPSALLAVRPALPLPSPDTSETPQPAPALPTVHAAVALGEGDAHFRLASPMHEKGAERPLSAPPPPSSSGAGRYSAQDKALPLDANISQSTPVPDNAASAEASSPAEASKSTRTMHRHHSRRRVHILSAPTMDTPAPAALPIAKTPAASRVL